MCAQFFFNFIVNFFSPSILTASFLGLGVLYVLVIIFTTKILLEIKIPLPIVRHNNRKDRNYMEERRTWKNFLLLYWIFLLSDGTVVLYLSLNIVFRINPYAHILQGYYDLALPGAIGALWGAGLAEVFHYGSLAIYGKNHLSSLELTKELKTSKDWYKEKSSYEQNLQILKKRVIYSAEAFSLIFMFLLFQFQSFFDKFPPI